MKFLRSAVILTALWGSLLTVSAVEKVSRSPYLGAIVVDDATGRVLVEDNADARGYPASVTKLMTFFVVMDKVHAGQLKLETPVTVSAEASRTGGSQVYLKQGEVFTVDDLLYALMIQSANDAAVALAEHCAGSKAAFVELMNTKARQLGMTSTTFQSPHGLPPAKGQQVDYTTARDLAKLSRELIDHGDVLRYSSVKVRTLRANTANPFEMRNHNHLLGKLAGCDGLKTGYFSAAGYSLAATIERNGRRVITVVLGSEVSKTRDFKVMELTEKGFAALPPLPSVTTAAPPAQATPGKAAMPPAEPPVVTVTTDKAPSPAPAPETPPPPAKEQADPNSTKPAPMFKFEVTPKKK